MKKQMDAALQETLTPRQYEAVCLRWREGLNGKEIGARMGISRSGVSHLLAAAERRVRREYEYRFG